MEQREGYVEHIRFRNAENGYTVFALSRPGEAEELTCVGTFPELAEGEYVRLPKEKITRVLSGKDFKSIFSHKKADKEEQEAKRESNKEEL